MAGRGGGSIAGRGGSMAGRGGSMAGRGGSMAEGEDGGGSLRVAGWSWVEGRTKQSAAVGLGGSSAGSWISERRRFSIV